MGVGDAQQVRTIRGTVTDENGKALPGAVVQLQDTNTFRIRSYITESDGAYHFAELPPDLTYHLQARYAGALSKSRISSKFDSHKVDTVNLTIHLSK
jgi:protocatechuate 3,4-dioxygenase beta subunit